MANEILLPPQSISFKDLYNQFPAHGNRVRKLIFQCELRSLEEGNASFGVIGYPAWKNSPSLIQDWNIGTKVEGVQIGDAGPNETFPLLPYVAFGNNEVLLEFRPLESEVEKGKERVNEEFEYLLKKILDNKDLFEESILKFKPRISKNPHAEYDITLDAGGSSATVSTNPSPPADPY